MYLGSVIDSTTVFCFGSPPGGVLEFYAHTPPVVLHVFEWHYSCVLFPRHLGDLGAHPPVVRHTF